ncbi:hypothetical protein CCACVL1_16066 [Corchorus capsularis]|uniref:Uncharacterized protein n=1 Tax=Corchorus capsularis TaxID=210143 RepID=A0A1R3HZI2_COCAP|nr:hypothetical protein CCACVL1_16066 [Corchorus capsularis]
MEEKEDKGGRARYGDGAVWGNIEKGRIGKSKKVEIVEISGAEKCFHMTIGAVNSETQQPGKPKIFKISAFLEFGDIDVSEADEADKLDPNIICAFLKSESVEEKDHVEPVEDYASF